MYLTVFSAAMLAGVALAGIGCRSQTGPASEAMSDGAAAPESIGSAADWDRLSQDARIAILDGGYRSYSNLTMSEKIAVDELEEADQRGFAEGMVSYLRSNGNMDIDDTTHSLVGGLNQKIQVLLLDQKTVLGGVVHFYQHGCDMADDSIQTFKSREDAELAGCEFSDSGWSTRGIFNRDGKPLEYADYMEWGAL